ncbi:hypothetical protein CSOJ01_14915 [Colletotrichum sojae]|uniref:SWIM-type domain-containing protein n=1 Tax=Colletotrichum sojae TaxID=2175907 RepID=A0A8H6MIS1_9PEZI|nr:hypothetical protein CSOJ01_14915 [Colletotrichum sojae]
MPLGPPAVALEMHEKACSTSLPSVVNRLAVVTPSELLNLRLRNESTAARYVGLESSSQSGIAQCTCVPRHQSPLCRHYILRLSARRDDSEISLLFLERFDIGALRVEEVSSSHAPIGQQVCRRMAAFNVRPNSGSFDKTCLESLVNMHLDIEFGGSRRQRLLFGMTA